jgi:retron-type reverse transcriptase
LRTETSELENIKKYEGTTKNMKRYGKIFPKIYEMENLYLAHANARRDKTFYKEVKMVDSDPEYYLGQIQEMLKSGSYEVSEYAVSMINDKGKERELMKLPYYPDRIIQWAIMLQIEHIFMEVFCSHTCASIYGRGIKEASRLTEKYMKNKFESRYCLKIDISKFYPNINHRILKKLLMKKIKDKKVLELLFKIIDSYPGEKGVPIGSYLSQYLANFYLSYFDHWLKEQMGVKYVVRYMDDIVIFHWSGQYLHWLLQQMENYLMTNLDLQIKPNHQVFPTAIRGVDFVGYRFFFGYKLLRKKTCKKLKKRMIQIKAKQDAGKLLNYREWCSGNSYIGWLMWCDSWRLYEKYIEPIIPSLLRYYKEVICKHFVTEEAGLVSFEEYKQKLLKKKGRLIA